MVELNNNNSNNYTNAINTYNNSGLIANNVNMKTGNNANTIGINLEAVSNLHLLGTYDYDYKRSKSMLG